MKSIFKLGIFQKLQVIKQVPMGVYMSLPDTLRESNEAKELILLPKREVPDGTQINDLINVFVYKDSEDRLVATTLKPYITLGEFAYLEVVGVTDIGAFLNWGLIKDLFLPFKEQTYRVKKGDKIALVVSDVCADVYKLSNEDIINGIRYILPDIKKMVQSNPELIEQYRDNFRFLFYLEI